MTIDPQFLTYGLYFLMAATAILVAEAGFVAVSARHARTSAINRRLKKLDENVDVESALALLRTERGLTATGEYRYPIIFLNRLYLQSGISGSLISFVGTFAIIALLAGAMVWWMTRSELLTAVVVSLTGLVLPPLTLLRFGARRRARFATQLPEAIDVVVRSLKAGHPTPVAISLVGREMPDPIGSEFGIVADEMTYGLELETAMRNLYERVGLDDLRLIVVSIGIQASTGGNLAEILGNLATVIRDRFRMRRKIRAISAEGRASGMLLSVLPFALFGLLNVIEPRFYGDVWGHPLITPALSAMVFWVLVGDYIMYRMVNFDF